jgi:pyruvate carboxylase
VGPSPEVLALFGDKTAARELAQLHGVPVLRGTGGGVTVDGVVEFLSSLGEGAAVMLKAVAGGGGRGSRIVTDVAEVPALFERCRSEAVASFGDGTLFAEELMSRARHIEVQIVGDGTGVVSHLWERDCSLQRRHQKLVEMAPAPGLAVVTRDALIADAVRLAEAVRYGSLGTFEFLVDADSGRHVFMEANPRLQVEHTVTEEILGIDLVRAQLELAGGATLADVGLDQPSVPGKRGFAVQCRVNMETMTSDGGAQPGGGVLTAFEVPSGNGYRTDSFGYVGYRTSVSFDSLLAKVIVHTPSEVLGDALAKAQRALAELRVEGVATNAAFLQAIVGHGEVRAGAVTTRFVDEHMAELVAAAAGQERLYVVAEEASAALEPGDRLAVLDSAAPGGLGAASAVSVVEEFDFSGGSSVVRSPMQGTVVSIEVAEGDPVAAGQQLLVMEAMKMEHVVTAEVAGFVRGVRVGVGDTVFEDHPLVVVEPADVGALTETTTSEI